MSFNGNLYATGEGTDLTTLGDLHGYSTENTRVPVGANSFILSADNTTSTGLNWVANTDAGLTLGTAGDIHTRNATDNVALAVGAGADGDLLTLDSAEAVKMKWATPSSSGATITDIFIYG